MIKTFSAYICFIYVFLSALPMASAAEVLVVTWRGQTEAEKGFLSRLKELRPGVKFQFLDAQRNKKRLQALFKARDLSGIDLVYTFGTTGSGIVKSHLDERIPQVFNIVTAPQKSKIVASLEKPGNNITGAKLGVDIDIQLDFLLSLKKVKTLGVWFDPREKQGKVLRDRIWAFAKKKNIKVIATRIIPDADEKRFEKMVQKAIAATKKMDAVYLIPTSSFSTIRDKYFSQFDPKLLVMSGVYATVGRGATIALTANYNERGRAAAELAHKVLSGTPAGTIPVDLLSLKSSYLYIDRKRVEAVGLRNIDNLGLRIVER